MTRFASVTSCVVFACFLHAAVLKSTPEDAHYVAAVLEYDYQSTMSANLANYQLYIAEAANRNVDIMVFPEMTLTRGSADSVRVPIYDLLTEYPTPALNPELYDEVLVNISYTARQHQVYVVINIQEAMDCSSTETRHELCPETKVYYFNTNVVFDRNGTVISRYRKIHLFGERGREQALSPDLGIFETDFGVRFGHFICFDLMFQVPAVQIASGVQDVIFTTMWFSELPYLTAVQIQEAYAYRLNINLLASGANRVAVGSAGSGIYSGQAGALVSTMPGTPTTRLLVATVPKIPGQSTDPAHKPGPIYDPPSDHDGLFLKVDPSLLAAHTQLLEEGDSVIDLQDGDTFCRFQVNITHGTAANRYRYRVSAFDGVRTFDHVASGGNKVCSVIACAGDDISSCGERFEKYNSESYATFSKLHIEANVPAPEFDTTLSAWDSIYYPVSLTSTIMPLEPDQYYFATLTVTEAGRLNMTYELVGPRDDLYSFGLWGRVFATDGEEPTQARDSAFGVMINSILVVLVILYHML